MEKDHCALEAEEIEEVEIVTSIVRRKETGCNSPRGGQTEKNTSNSPTAPCAPITPIGPSPTTSRASFNPTNTSTPPGPDTTPAAGTSSSKRKRTANPAATLRRDTKRTKTIAAPKMADKKKAVSIAAATAAAAAASRNTAAATSNSASTNDPFEKMQLFMETQFKVTNNNISSISESVATLNERCEQNSSELKEIRKTAEKNSSELAALYGVVGEKDSKRREEIKHLQEAVARIERGGRNGKIVEEVQRRVREEVANSIGTSKSYAEAAASGKRVAHRTMTREADFMRARRSIRIWPVEEGKLEDEAMDYIREKLKVPTGSVGMSDVEEIRRVPTSGRFSGIKDEVLITFGSVSVRDLVASHARNLGQWIDNNGKPTAGIRLEIPDHLVGVHKDLKSYGAHLRQQHGEGLKRQIKFDDSANSFYMDVRLPNNNEWLRVSGEMAREERSAIERTQAARTRIRLSSNTSSNGNGVDSPSEMDTTPGSPVIPQSATLIKHGHKKGKNWDNQL